jgi:hypothetical protein
MAVVIKAGAGEGARFFSDAKKGLATLLAAMKTLVA